MVGQLGRVVLLSKTHETSLSHISTLSEPQGGLYNLTLGGYFMVVQGGFEAATGSLWSLKPNLTSALEPSSLMTAPLVPAIQLMMQLALYKA